ncbi:MAG: GxxExxY protein [Candidatus Cloacimonadia bacterium]
MLKDLIYKEEFYEIKQACIEVRKILGNGFLEKVYENALKKELERQGFKIEQQKEILVYYKDFVVGQYFADLIVNEKIIIELKCATEITSLHKAQLLNYLKAAGYKLGIIINFPNDKKGFEIERVPNFNQ